jgi:hypothetical protein
LDDNSDVQAEISYLSRFSDRFTLSPVHIRSQGQPNRAGSTNSFNHPDQPRFRLGYVSSSTRASSFELSDLSGFDKWMVPSVEFGENG